jgi:glutamate formiminotransferase
MGSLQIWQGFLHDAFPTLLIPIFIYNNSQINRRNMKHKKIKRIFKKMVNAIIENIKNMEPPPNSGQFPLNPFGF